jgi:hypothetical protein
MHATPDSYHNLPSNFWGDSFFVFFNRLFFWLGEPRFYDTDVLAHVPRLRNPSRLTAPKADVFSPQGNVIFVYRADADPM